MKTLCTIFVFFFIIGSNLLFSQPIKGYDNIREQIVPQPIGRSQDIIKPTTSKKSKESEIHLISDKVEKIVFTESFSNNSLDNKWIANPGTKDMSSFDDPVEGKVLKIENKGKNKTVFLEYDLTSLVVGKQVKLSGMIRHENIISGSKVWEIGQLSIEYRLNQDKVYESVQELSGTSEWSEHLARNDGGTDIDNSEYGDYVFKIPENATHVRLYLGLQNCTGTIYFKDIKVIILE